MHDNSSTFGIYNDVNNEWMVQCLLNGAVNLYHNGASKLTTTSTGVDVTGNATFADDGKAIFGAGSDLEISSNGTTGIIRTGNSSSDIRLESDNRIVICDRSFNETFAVFNDDGDVKLYYDNAAKLSTTSTGIDVTGTAVTDGLTVAGNVSGRRHNQAGRELSCWYKQRGVG